MSANVASSSPVEGSRVAPHSGTRSPQEELAALRKAYQENPYPEYSERRALLDRLLQACLDQRETIAEAASKDWGHRCRVDSLLGDVFPTVNAIKFARSELRGWMKPQRRTTTLNFRPGHNRVLYQPLGVVGIIAPWNYPFQLCVEPLVFAIAAGNRVLIKPSEFTPHTSTLLENLLTDALGQDYVRVVHGDAKVSQAFSELPLDHLLFTGSTRVGKLVMRAAAENLVPVTLELGGKSPALIHPEFPLERAAASIASGKCFNAGQTCVAPDYVLVPRPQMEPLVAALSAEIQRRYPSVDDNPDYSAIASDAHYHRLTGLVEDARAQGATVVTPTTSGGPQSRKLPPTLLLDVHDEMAVMQEEIFGPILPLIPYDTVDEAVRYINDRPRPLAFYYFDENSQRADQVLRDTLSGSACINDCLLQFAQDHIPFGGVGDSGMGAYHGREGFETFSHRRGVYYQSRFNLMHLQAPPFGPRIEKLLNYLLR